MNNHSKRLTTILILTTFLSAGFTFGAMAEEDPLCGVEEPSDPADGHCDADGNYIPPTKDDIACGLEDSNTPDDGTCENGVYSPPVDEPDTDAAICELENDNDPKDGSCDGDTYRPPSGDDVLGDLLAEHDPGTCTPEREATPVEIALTQAMEDFAAHIKNVNDTVLSQIDGPEGGDLHNTHKNEPNGIQDWEAWSEPLDFDIDEDCVADAWEITVDRNDAFLKGGNEGVDDVSNQSLVIQVDFFYGLPGEWVTIEGGDSFRMSAEAELITPYTDNSYYRRHNNIEGYSLHHTAGRADIAWADGLANITMYNATSDMTVHTESNDGQTEWARLDPVQHAMAYVSTNFVGLAEDGSTAGEFAAYLQDILAGGDPAGFRGLELEPDPTIANRGIWTGTLHPDLKEQDLPYFFVPSKFHRLRLIGFNEIGNRVHDMDEDGANDKNEIEIRANPFNKRSVPGDEDGDGFRTAGGEDEFPQDPERAKNFAPITDIDLIRTTDGAPVIGPLHGDVVVSFDYTVQPEEPEVLFADLAFKTRNKAKARDAWCVVATDIEPTTSTYTFAEGGSGTFVIPIDTNVCPDSEPDTGAGRNDGPLFLEILYRGDPGDEEKLEAGIFVFAHVYNETSGVTPWEIRNRPLVTPPILAEAPNSDDPINYTGSYSESVKINWTATDPTAGDTVESVRVDLFRHTFRTVNNRQIFFDQFYKSWEPNVTDVLQPDGNFSFDANGLREAAAVAGPQRILDIPGYQLRVSLTDAHGKTESVDSPTFGMFHNDPLVISGPTDDKQNPGPIPMFELNGTTDGGRNVLVIVAAKFRDPDARQFTATSSITEADNLTVDYRQVGDSAWQTCHLTDQHFYKKPHSVAFQQRDKVTGQDPFDLVPVSGQRQCELELLNSNIPYEFRFSGGDHVQKNETKFPAEGEAPFQFTTHQPALLENLTINENKSTTKQNIWEINVTADLVERATLAPGTTDDLKVFVTYQIGTEEGGSGPVTAGSEIGPFEMQLLSGSPLDGTYWHEAELAGGAFYVVNVTTEIGRWQPGTEDTTKETIVPNPIIDIDAGPYGNHLETAKRLASDGIEAGLDLVQAAFDSGQPLPAYWCAKHTLDAQVIPSDNLNPVCALGQNADLDTDLDGEMNAYEAFVGSDPEDPYSVTADKDRDLVMDALEAFVDVDLWEIPGNPSTAEAKQGRVQMLEDKSVALIGLDAELQEFEFMRFTESHDQRLVEITMEHPEQRDPDSGERQVYTLYLGGAYLDPEIYSPSGADGDDVTDTDNDYALRIWIRDVWNHDSALGVIDIVPQHFAIADKPLVNITFFEGDYNEAAYTDGVTAEANGNSVSSDVTYEQRSLEMFTDPIRFVNENGDVVEQGYRVYETFISPTAVAPPTHNGAIISDEHSHVYINRTDNGTWRYEVQFKEDHNNFFYPEQLDGKRYEGETPKLWPQLGIRDTDDGLYEVYFDCDNDGSDELSSGGAAAECQDSDGDHVHDGVEDLACRDAQFDEIDSTRDGLAVCHDRGDGTQDVMLPDPTGGA